MGKGIRLEIQTGVILAAAAALLILPLSLLLAFLLAAFVHELCHYLMLCWNDVKTYKVSIGPFGATMETEPMEPGREVLCALAGPAGSFLLAACYGILPEIALCALVQGCFNLLPIYPMDGGRVLNGMLELMKIQERDKIMLFIQRFTGGVISFVCLYGFLRWKMGCGVLIFGIVVLLRTLLRKTPCKQGFFGVQ